MGLMLATADDYSEVLHALRPVGPAMVADDILLRGLAVEFARLHNRLGDLLNESDPRTTTELRGDWERAFGLPDNCCSSEQDIVARAAALISRVRGAGSPTPEYFIALAAELGYTITITELRPFMVTSPVNDPLDPAAIRHVWQVRSAITISNRFAVTSAVNDPLASWGNDILECVINRAKPAHTHVQFIYEDPADGWPETARETTAGDLRITSDGYSRRID